MKTDISSNEKLLESDHSTDDIFSQNNNVDDEAHLLSSNQFNNDNTSFLQIYKEFFTFSYIPLISIIPSIISGASPIIIYSLLGKIINILTKWNKDQSKDPLPEVIKICLLISFLVLISSIATFFQSYLWTKNGYLFSNKLRQNLYQSLMMSDVTFYDSHSIGSLIALLSDDAETVQNSFGPIKGSQIFRLGQFLFGTIMCLFYSWKMPFISFMLFIPISFYISQKLSKKVKESSEVKFKYMSNSITIAEETISSIKTVRSFNSEESEIERYLHELDQTRDEEKQFYKLNGYLFFSQSFLLWMIIFINIYYGGIMIYNNKYESGYMLSIFGMMYNGGFALIYFLNSIPDEQKAIASCHRILNMTKNCSSFELNENTKIKIDDFKGKIEFVDVSFKYPTRDVYVLNNVSFTIYPGQICAFVGNSGSGKSTVIQLIEGFYYCNEGVILFDDVDIRDIDLNWLHKKIGLVSQDTSLFQMSIKENIEYGIGNANYDENVGFNNSEKLNKVIEIANLKKFVSKYSLSYNVGEKGSIISGGQKQRIVIARAIIKDPVILITDDATSALDSNNERMVQNALMKIMKNKTALIVAHRLSTIKNTDYIFVFDNGEIKERGRHDDLIQMKGIYFELIKKQL